MANPYARFRTRTQLVLQALDRLAPAFLDGTYEVTRDDLCRESGLSARTVTRALKDLEVNKAASIVRASGIGVRIKRPA